MTNEILLGVNIDHVATVRQARGTRYPDPVQAAIEAEEAGADGITLHMREDLRHIQARDVRLIKAVLQTRMNLELAVTDAMLDFAEEIKPEHTCLVPEKREELTTEGGLDVISHHHAVAAAVKRLEAIGSEVSLFIDPDRKQIEAAVDVGARVIEIHTGCYADATNPIEQAHELHRITEAANYAASLNLIVNAGHGLNYHNVKPIAAIKEVRELNIGHAIIARALFSGFKEAVRHMRQLMLEARSYGKY
ncbi:pyridoxal phosphate biosynthetic protein PdxJ [Legionella lansingensis]|uniref:Pyridoxine 5'-phosphate synthase n=1 Tax=Legionella lansingensis TaxID=45067 RepID=A0A0W0VX60_9GAMM|nr:pyridoxine 5'-phosphate synthase [Legionella lansingensis]KTD24816.1 pyridoxal phosphate biosynthetic protein PdxJ [Legionella lansingensis]SNV49066.1 pyridoxal phosphate biosynthetic protein PdxJ [Legionella lansingensis]